MGALGKAYMDNDVANYSVSTGNYTAWNQGWAYRNDAVDIGSTEKFPTFPYYVGWTEAGEWMQYTIDVLSAGEFTLKYTWASNISSGAPLKFILNGSELANVHCPSTESWDDWQSANVKVELTGGMQKLKIFFPEGGLNLYSLEFKLEKAFGIIDDMEGILIQPIPNPAVSMPELQLTVLRSGQLSINIYNLLGQKLIKTLHSTVVPNHYAFQLLDSATQVPSGIYFLKLQFDNEIKTIKFTFLQ